MLMCISSFVDKDSGESCQAYRDRVDESHYLARVHPECFEPSTDGPESMVVRVTPEAPRLVERTTPRSARRSSRTSEVRSRSERLPLAEEDRRRRERLAELDAEDKARFETESTRAQRQFWAATDRYLDQIDPSRVQVRRREEQEDAESQERVDALGRYYREVVEDACSGWGDDFQWN